MGRLLAAVVAFAATAGVTGAPPPSPEERQRLARSEIVYRVGAAPREGTVVPGARGAVAFVRVPTGPDPIWAILTEPTRYPEIFPGLRAVEVLESSERAWLLKTEGKVGPFSFRYFTRYQLEPDARTITWRLDTTRDNDVFDDNWGWWQLVPEDGSTVVVYAIGSVASSWQPLAGFFERRGITQALGALRDAAVRRGRT
jgi:ribosome-associated toxin RatA of RatAB toxin-antitoxin module